MCSGITVSRVSIDDILDSIIRREGNAYTNDPADRGGPTKYGVTQQTLSNYRGRPVSPGEVAALTAQEARQIYRRLYISPFEKLQIEGPLLGLLVDCGVNSGPRTATRWLQQAAGLVADGVIGPKTQHAVHTQNWRKLYAKLLAIRYSHYALLVASDGTQRRFIKGWTNRANEFLMGLV